MGRITPTGVGFYLSAPPTPDLLSTVTNGIGGVTTISYTPSSAYANYQLPFITQTVSSLSVNDGNGHISTTNYTYAGGKYDPVEREFKGFDYLKGTVNLTDVPGVTSVFTETWFSQTVPYSGLPLDQMVKDSSGKIYSRSINTYQTSTPYTGVSFPKLTKKEDYLCDGVTTNPAYLDDCRKVVTEFEVDGYGNPTRKLFWGDVDVPGDGRDEYTVYTNDLTNWMFLPNQTYVYDSTGVVKAMAWLSYDSKGNLVAKTDWLEGGTSPVTSFDYDIYGNQIAVTDPRGSTGAIEYDATNTYPVKTTNPLGHTAYTTYDYRTGKPLTKTDPNGNVATLEYDPFGRPLEAVNPHDGASAAAWSESYYDGLGRVIKTKTAGPDGKAIVSETLYNYRGLVQQTSSPYFVDGGDQPLETKRWTVFTYDALGRPIRIDSPDGTYGLKLYNQNRTTLVDANGHVKVEEKDVYGKLVKVEEYSGVYPNQTLYATTTYDYDILGNLLKVTDALGNETLMVYDSLSRKIAMQDPDMGFWSYQYDDNGNLVSQTDAKNQTITFTYDALNRVTLKDYPTGTDVVYTYDDPAVSNSKGKLTKVTDASGTEEYSYDTLGRAWKITKTVDSVAYVTETAFDALGRPASIKYPDNETVTYSYDAAGNLTNVSGYVTFTSFNALGQAGATTYANGVTTTQQYYADNNRLYSITTNSPGQGGLQNLTYEYDNGGNVQSINDLLDPNRTQTFTYDHLNRLTQAESVAYGSTLTYQYNEIGNMLYNSQVGSYFYSPTKPHAVIQAGTNIYEYDDNGNMTRRVGNSITYDYDNRATILVGTNGTVNSVYDFTGQRIKKIVGSNTTIYIGKLYECKAGNCTKYVFAGGTRIASKSSGGTYYYHGDHLGSASIVTDALGNKVQEIYYYPFGGTRLNNGTVNVRYKFTDQEEDAETGLYYYGARYYDPQLARFISADTLVQAPDDPQTLNRFAYVRNNPLLYIDPSGNIFGIDDLIATVIVSAVVGAVSSGAQSNWKVGEMLKGAVIGAVSGAIGYGAGSWAFSAAGGKGFGALMAGGIVGGAAGGAAGGGLYAAVYGGNIGQGILTGAEFGALAGGITAGLIYAGVPNAIAAGGGGFASGYIECGGRCAGEGFLYSFAGAVLRNALTIVGVDAEGKVPKKGSEELAKMRSKNDTYVTTPEISLKGDNALWLFIALISGGYSHTWHTNDVYVPEGHYYKHVESNVTNPGEGYNHIAPGTTIFTNKTGAGYNIFTRNCTTRFDGNYMLPARYRANFNYPEQGAFWWRR